MSRVFMAAHFPHQVVAGVITGGPTLKKRRSASMMCNRGLINCCLCCVSGVLVAKIVSKSKWMYNASMNKYFFITFHLTFFAVGFYLLLRTLGVDLLWTLDKAQKWCVKPEWIHLDSTPFASLLRNMGSLLGLGMGLHSPIHNGVKKKSSTTAFKIGSITISLFLLQLLDEWTFSSENHLIFYILSFCKSAIALLIPTAVVPWALCRIFTGKTDGKNL